MSTPIIAAYKQLIDQIENHGYWADQEDNCGVVVTLRDAIRDVEEFLLTGDPEAIGRAVRDSTYLLTCSDIHGEWHNQAAYVEAREALMKARKVASRRTCRNGETRS